MRICLLGTGAGGGVPQWNCNCPVCRAARAGRAEVAPRTQSCVAISADERHWFLLNASPDLRAQMQGFPALWPAPDQVRSSPVQAVLLTNADLDHTLGLFLLREGEKLRVHASESIQGSLSDGLALGSTLAKFSDLDWVTPPADVSPLLNRDGSESGLVYQAIDLAGLPPRFARRSGHVESMEPAKAHVLGYFFKDQKTGGRMLFLPAVARIEQALRVRFNQCDILFFDGTFWSEHEMEERGVGKIPASQMGHVPISGPGGSLELLKNLSVKKKLYFHMNNTNPILMEHSAERAAVVEAGVEVARDGMEFCL